MSRRDIIAIGGSLGAVEAVRLLCRSLPSDFDAALFIAIHVGAHGNDMLADILAEHASITASTAKDGDKPRRGHAYIAPADHHLLLIDGEVRLGRGPRENMARPAIDPLFRSAGVSFGPRAIGVVLTGLLKDGASGLADLKRCGGLAVAQNPRDAKAPDMPREALHSAEVDYRAPLGDLPALLTALSRQEAAPPPDIPADIRGEIEIALGTPRTAILSPDITELGAPTCPARGVFTAEALAAQKEGSVDEAMRVALRILEERVHLTETMAEEARQTGRSAAARSYEERLGEIKSNAELLRDAIDKA